MLALREGARRPDLRIDIYAYRYTCKCLTPNVALAPRFVRSEEV